MSTQYNYIIRPAEGTGDLIIEIIDLPEDKDFVKQLIRAFESINIQVVNYEDLWMNDEIVLNAASDTGPFTIYRDAAGGYYITANDNPDIIPVLDKILSDTGLFSKIINK
jgi:hypothetical protein